MAALPHVAAEIARLRAARSERTQIKADWVLERWAALASPGLDEDVPAAVQKSALDSIAKHLGMFEKKPPKAENVMLVLNMGRPPDDDDRRETDGMRPGHGQSVQIPAGPSAKVGDASSGLAAM